MRVQSTARRCLGAATAVALMALLVTARAGDESALRERLEAASATAGAEAFDICAACHSDGRDGEAMIGPGLWGIVNKPVGSEPGFGYSDALLAFGGIWTLERLEAVIENPNALIPGNTMRFYGIRNAQDRADILAYLMTLTDRAESDAK